MIKKCNFRTHGIYSIPAPSEDCPKMYCSMKTHDTALSKDGKTIDCFVKVNSLCDGEDKCILYQIYRYVFNHL